MRLRIIKCVGILTISLGILVSFNSPGLCQEDAESKVQRILSEVTSLPNFPKLNPFKIKIDKTLSPRGYAYYFRHPQKRFFFQRTGLPTIHICKQWINDNSDDALRVILVHELGHHFDPTLNLYFQPKNSEKIIMNFRKEEENQYFAEAFALYILGEDLFKKGHNDHGLANYKKESGSRWLYIESNPILYQYLMDRLNLWTNYWLSGAKTKLDIVEKLIQVQSLKQPLK